MRLHFIGNAHLDPVWLWGWQEGFAEAKATFRSALDRMKEFPDFVFTCAGAGMYKFIEENCPEMFDEIKQRVGEGRWVIVGGMWIQPDCNLPSGESFARHGLYSQRYFMEKFGRICNTGYNVDSFGHNQTLPQILRKCGMENYVFMRPGEHEKSLPSNLFWWESNSGDKVLAYRIPVAYCNRFDDDAEFGRHLDEFYNNIKGDMPEAMFFYGVGNHGGGPTVNQLRIITERIKNGADYVLSSPDEYFKQIRESDADIPAISDDLQHHAMGCYSAVSEIKQGNRRCEHKLLAAESFSVMANVLMGLQYPKRQLDAAWENVLYNHFHDIMGGCSIRQGCDNAIEFHGESLTLSAKVENSAVQRMSWAIDTANGMDVALSMGDHWSWESELMPLPFVVFNPHSFEVEAAVTVNKQLTSVTDEQGNSIPFQHITNKTRPAHDVEFTTFMAKVPALGYRVYRVSTFKQSEVAQGNVVAGGNFLENEYICVTFGADGFIKSMYDKQAQREVFAKSAAVPIVLDESDCDTWAHDRLMLGEQIGVFNCAEMQLTECGGLTASMRCVYRYGSSEIAQTFTIYSGRKELEVTCDMFVCEKHKAIKIELPANVCADVATYEIPYGTIARPTNGWEEAMHRFVDATDNSGDYGVTILNDSKYSASVSGGTIGITACRTPIYADHGGPRHSHSEYTDQGKQSFKYVILPHVGKLDCGSTIRRSAILNQPLTTIMETYHKGSLPEVFGGISVSAPNVIASAIKQAEDGDGYILRCYETDGVAVDALIELPLLKASVSASFAPHEIKTLSIKSDGITEVNILEI